jgi:4-hydroxybenzoate polyprenyltransferase
MAFTAYDQPLNHIVWFLFAGNVAWTLAYDTLYAMVDRDDDLLIGVKSTAIMFGRYDLLAVGCSQLGALVAFGYAFWLADLGPLTLMGILAATLLTLRQHGVARSRSREACFQAFIESHRFGAALFLGSVLGAI